MHDISPTTTRGSTKSSHTAQYCIALHHPTDYDALMYDYFGVLSLSMYIVLIGMSHGVNHRLLTAFYPGEFVAKHQLSHLQLIFCRFCLLAKGQLCYVGGENIRDVCLILIVQPFNQSINQIHCARNFENCSREVVVCLMSTIQPFYRPTTEHYDLTHCSGTGPPSR